MTQSFFSLSVGFGSLITYSSYNRFTQDIYRDALIISVGSFHIVVYDDVNAMHELKQVADTLTSLLAGCVIFSILGNLALELGVDVDKVRDRERLL